MKYVLTIVCAFLLQMASSQVYTRIYEVKSDDETVGEITASKHKEGEYVQYDVESNVYMTMIFKIHVSYKVQATYKEGVLVSSSATVYVNDKVQSNVDVQRKGNHYDILNDEHTTRIYEDIKFSSAKLYFEEPKEVKTSFSETSGVLKPLTKTADGNYRLKDPDKESNVNTYNYSSDQGLHSINIERSLFPTLKVVHVREVGEIDTKEE